MATVQEIIADRFISALDKDIVPWRQSWGKDYADGEGEQRNAVTNDPYNGINIWMTQITQILEGYEDCRWVTHKGARQLGGKVRSEETNKGTPIVYYNVYENETGELDSNGKPVLEDRWVCRFFNVFNVEQCENLTVLEEKDAKKVLEASLAESYPLPKPKKINKAKAIVDKWLSRENPSRTIEAKKGRPSSACYVPSKDIIRMPNHGDFDTQEDFYATYFHEIGHATGHHSRLNRFKVDAKIAPFGSEDYSKEELVAEMTSAFLSHHAGISNQTLPQSEAYIQNWAKYLSDNKKAVFDASREAQKASDYIRGVGGV